ncbi:hypothetical protein KC221_25685, partial [Mycobacterium tuberculosis]|nr:hypothetical protein [Mycobacterium tuberculosis]
ITAADIMGQTAAYFSLTLDDLCGTSRSRTLTTARQIAMYLCRELTDLSLPVRPPSASRLAVAAPPEPRSRAGCAAARGPPRARAGGV